MLCGKISPHGDARERTATYFANGLVKRMAGRLHTSTKNLQQKSSSQNPEDRFPAYIALTKLTPFIRFAHLTANQAILEAVETTDEIHIVDLDIMQGVQWPPLMQALAQRDGCPPRLLHITGMGSTVSILNQTGARLADFANSLGIPFEFHALHGGIEALTSSLLTRTTGGALVVNAVMQLPHLLENEFLTWPSVLKALQWLSPKVVTVAEQQFSPRCHDLRQQQFFDRFSEAFRHYSAIFESLDATLPATSLERLDIEQSWLGSEIVDMVCSKDTYGTESRQQTTHWKLLMKRAGFNVTPQSKFAVAQARLLLKLCYPADGYQLMEDAAGYLFLGWQDTLLCSVSSWKQQVL
ncbi:hypothetical protein O6H91_Y544900 [Diphasiastrum complanatum]|nr:hypothetical protein O6H91_Y544900 [Diphasiastrum complanatum]